MTRDKFNEEELKELLVLKLKSYSLAELTYFLKPLLKPLLKPDIKNTGGLNYYHGTSLEPLLTKEDIFENIYKEVGVEAKDIVKKSLALKVINDLVEEGIL